MIKVSLKSSLTFANFKILNKHRASSEIIRHTKHCIPHFKVSKSMERNDRFSLFLNVLLFTKISIGEYLCAKSLSLKL